MTKKEHYGLGKSHALWRACIVLAVAVGCLGAGSAPAQDAAETYTGPPDAEDFQAGDLIWPKKPNAIIPYNATLDESSPTDSELWSKERDDYLSKLKSSPSLTPDDLERIELLKNMSYGTFLEVYGEGVTPEAVTPYGGRFGVGHVAIVRVIDGKVKIVEAMWGIGVREIAYEDWIAERKGQWIWHGRLKRKDATSRAKVAERAAKQLGKPYEFWNFNLEDDAGFYCSKLAWLAIREATGVVVDDKPEPKRRLWLSPKQLLRSPHLQILENPGDYRGSRETLR